MPEFFYASLFTMAFASKEKHWLYKKRGQLKLVVPFCLKIKKQNYCF